MNQAEENKIAEVLAKLAFRLNKLDQTKISIETSSVATDATMCIMEIMENDDLRIKFDQVCHSNGLNPSPFTPRTLTERGRL